jgi:putative nucleotidyltransferase with HDIG domain
MTPSDAPEEESEQRELTPYAGRWVASLGGQIIGQGGTPEQARRAGKASRFKEEPSITYVSTSQPFSFHPIFTRIGDFLPGESKVYLVGGAVRDAILNQVSRDLDFAVAGKAINLARRVANELGGAFYPLDQERDYGRVVLQERGQNRLIIDFTPVQAGDLETDLRARDFTINAMAVELHEPQSLLDPLGGLADLRNKQLRACSNHSISDDPIRILRAVRFAARFNLHILPDTRSTMKEAVSGLSFVSMERLRDELFNILSGPRPATCLRVLDRIGAAAYVLPELENLKGVQQSSPHIYDVWEHTIEVLENLQFVYDVLSPSYDPETASSLYLALIALRIGRYREQLNKHLETTLAPGRTVFALLSLALLFHDIAKPQTREMDDHGSVRFLNHDQIGARIAHQLAQNLQLSNAETNRIETVVRHHMRPFLLTQTGKPPTRRAIYRFFRDTGPAGVDICILSLADMLGTYGPTLPIETWANLLEVIRVLLQAWWEEPQESVSPPSLLNGHELIKEMNLEPGKIVGDILEAIREAQATGKVRNRREALDLAREKLKGSIDG